METKNFTTWEIEPQLNGYESSQINVKSNAKWLLVNAEYNIISFLTETDVRAMEEDFNDPVTSAAVLDLKIGESYTCDYMYIYTRIA